MLRAAIIPALSLFLLAGWPAIAPASSAGSQPAAGTADQSGARTAKKAPKQRARARCRVYTPPRYRQMAANWRKEPRIPAPRWREGFRDLVLYSVNLGERVRFFPFLPDGALDPEAVGQVERVMRDHHTDALHAVNQRLVKLLYRLADRFEARQITVISGYRRPGDEAEGGHHGRGNAVDIVLCGVSLPAQAKFARQLGRVGVGFYPNAGFIHLDVRERSYFWVDRSGPGSRGCPVGIMRESAMRWDRRWRPEHDEPVPRRDRHGVPLGAEPAEPDVDAGSDDSTWPEPVAGRRGPC